MEIFQNSHKNSPQQRWCFEQVRKKISKLTKHLKYLNENYDKYTANAFKQSDLKQRKIIRKGKSAKDIGKIENIIKDIISEISYLKK